MHLFAFLRAADPRSRITIAVFAIGQLALALLLVAVLLAGAAHAQDAGAVAPVTVYDFGPWVGPLLDFLAPTILGVASLLGLWVLNRVSSWLGLRIDADRRQAVEQGLAHAVAFAIEKVGDRARGGIPVDLKSEAIATAAGYAQRSVPGALKHFGVDSHRLGEMIESRLEGLIFDPAAPADETNVVSSRVLRAPIS
ncbi:hypothetical protein [Aureimonas sp. SK2]|uniref:hypothetical protein n=1 Tax=Aureimonas sp. SK2 TaxID=3015992 RepID=UPI0024438266|nr:hypothetical protein [Aureimonas sp. SK2]